MKKIGIIICLIAFFIIIYVLQANFFSWFNLATIKPNLFIIFVFVIGLFSGKSIGVVLGAFFGISLDFFLGKSIGISAIMLGTIGFLGGYLDKKFSKDSRITIIIMITISTFIYEIGLYLFNYFINMVQIDIFTFLKILLIEIIYNAIITIIIYPVIINLGYKIEENFKENKILTRYY